MSPLKSSTLTTTASPFAHVYLPISLSCLALCAPPPPPPLSKLLLLMTLPPPFTHTSSLSPTNLSPSPNSQWLYRISSSCVSFSAQIPNYSHKHPRISPTLWLEGHLKQNTKALLTRALHHKASCREGDQIKTSPIQHHPYASGTFPGLR